MYTKYTQKRAFFSLRFSILSNPFVHSRPSRKNCIFKKKKRKNCLQTAEHLYLFSCVFLLLFVCFKQLVVWWVFWTCDRQSVVDMLPQPRPVSHWTFSLIKMKFLFSSSQFLMDWFYWSTGRRETRYRKKVKVGRAVQEGAVVTSIVFSLLISFISAIF